MVASEETIPGNGYQYAYILNKFATQVPSSLTFAQHMVNTYNQEYSGTTDYTLSATDLNACGALVNNCNAVAQILTSQLKGKNGRIVKGVIKKCSSASSCPSFDQGIYVDLCQFYRNILKNISSLQLPPSITVQFQQLLNDGTKMFSTIIKANVTSNNYRQAGGLSIY